MTRRLAHYRAGDEIEVWGPLGNGFPPVATDHLIMVAGGIGQTPFQALGQEYLGTRQYGDPPRSVPTRQASDAVLRRANRRTGGRRSDFQAAGIDVRLSSDDGTVGHHGFVTDLLATTCSTKIRSENRLVVCCGPEPMMEPSPKSASANNTRCFVSLETPMACGIGICFSCVTKVRQPDGSWD